MRRPDQLNALRKKAIAELFWEWCEFAAIDEPPPGWCGLKSGEPLQVIGKDASGGRFCTFPAASDFSGRLLFADSEGRAGVIADSLTDGVRMMIALPTWRDCLQFSGGGKIKEMRRAEELSKRHFQKYHPGAEANRAKLSQAFALAPLVAAIDTLHRVVTEGLKVKVVSTIHGTEYEGLFGSFKPNECRSWQE
jgi:hypothetical protein